VLAANWTEVGVALLVVSLRMYTQIFVLGHVGWDDYTIVLSWVGSSDPLSESGR
jgi:hypothetical protein